MFTQLLFTGGICTVGWFMIFRGVPGPSSLLPLAWPSSAPSMNSMFNLHHSSLSHLPILGPLGAACTPTPTPCCPKLQSRGCTVHTVLSGSFRTGLFPRGGARCQDGWRVSRHQSSHSILGILFLPAVLATLSAVTSSDP